MLSLIINHTILDLPDRFKEKVSLCSSEIAPSPLLSDDNSIRTEVKSALA